MIKKTRCHRPRLLNSLNNIYALLWVGGIALRFGKEKGFFCCLLPVKLGCSPFAGGGGGGVEEKAIFIPFSKLDELYKLHISLAISLGEPQPCTNHVTKAGTKQSGIHLVTSYQLPPPHPPVSYVDLSRRPCPIMCVFLPLMAPVCVLLPIWDIYKVRLGLITNSPCRYGLSLGSQVSDK